jgi:hypothetical protein
MESILTDILLTAALALVGTTALVVLGIRVHNQEAKAKGLSEKGYSVGSVVVGFLVGFVTLFALIFYSLFLKGRYGR